MHSDRNEENPLHVATQDILAPFFFLCCKELKKGKNMRKATMS